MKRSLVMRLFFACFLAFFFLPNGRMVAQIKADRVKIDFGEVDRSTDRVVDITFLNTGDKDAIVLTTESMPEYTTRWSDRRVAPGETVVLRVKFNPPKKGRYNDRLTVFFSTMNQAIDIEFKSDVQFVDRSDNPACPDFGSRPAGCCNDDPFTVEVVDKLTAEPIRNARVQIYERGRRQRDVKTDREGIYSEEIPIGFYFTIASAEGYLSEDTTGYINRRNNYIRFELMPREPVEEIVFVPEPEPSSKPVIEEITEDVAEEFPVVEAEEPKPAVEEVIQPKVKVTSTVLPEDQFAPNNVVFLVDVSQSMYYKSRLELLKIGMLEMIDVLRSVDRVALISYAQTTEEVIGLTSAKGSGELENAISGLVASGRTAGAKGFKRAYGMLERHTGETAGNQVIVVTDGAFRTTDAQKIIEMAEEYAARGITTSIVGVRCSEAGREKLESIAAACGGNFIEINEAGEGGDRLLRELAERSKITR